MIDPQIKLLSKVYTFDEIGNEIETITEIDVPILRIESVYANEFYRASQSNFKPELRLVISEYNYNNENEFIYKGINYSIIRTENANQDELILIAERKNKDA